MSRWSQRNATLRWRRSTKRITVSHNRLAVCIAFLVSDGSGGSGIGDGGVDIILLFVASPFQRVNEGTAKQAVDCIHSGGELALLSLLLLRFVFNSRTGRGGSGGNCIQEDARHVDKSWSRIMEMVVVGQKNK